MALTEAQQLVIGKARSRAKFVVGNKTDIPKILLIKLGAVGELVMASPFFDQLRKHFPHSEIVLVVGRSSFPAVEHNLNISRFILADDVGLYRGGGVRRSLEFFRLLCKLRREDFDLSFVLERGMAFRLLSCLAGLPVRVGFGSVREDFFLTHSVPGHQTQNESETYLNLLRKMDIPAVFEKTFYYLSDEEKEFQNLFLERHSIVNGEQVIALAPGAGGNTRSKTISGHWPAQNYIELINRFQSDGPCRILLVGGPDDREITDTIIGSCPDCLDATDLSFGEMASVLRGCSLFIGEDSARNQIAVAIGIASIGIFNPADSRPSISFSTINDASAAALKANSSRIEFPGAVSVDEIWQLVETMDDYCQ